MMMLLFLAVFVFGFAAIGLIGGGLVLLLSSSRPAGAETLKPAAQAPGAGEAIDPAR